MNDCLCRPCSIEGSGHTVGVGVNRRAELADGEGNCEALTAGRNVEMDAAFVVTQQDQTRSNPSIDGRVALESLPLVE